MTIANGLELLKEVERRFPDYMRGDYRNASGVTELISQNRGIFKQNDQLNFIASIDRFVEVARQHPTAKEINRAIMPLLYKRTLDSYDMLRDFFFVTQEASAKLAEYFEPPGVSEGLMSLDDIKPEDRKIVVKGQRDAADFRNMAERSLDFVEEMEAQKKLAGLYIKGRLIELEMTDVVRELGI